MKKQLIVIGTAVLLVVVGLCGCVGEFNKEIKKGLNGDEDEKEEKFTTLADGTKYR